MESLIVARYVLMKARQCVLVSTSKVLSFVKSNKPTDEEAEVWSILGSQPVTLVSHWWR